MIPEEDPVKVYIKKLAIGVHKTWIEMARVQLELKLKITKLYLRARHPMPLEVKEQWTTTITERVAVVESAVADYTQFFEQSFEVLTNL